MITIVSGLPRSGTSMMMEMLQAGGMELVTDRARGADPSNPKGYFEDERVKQLRDDSSWLSEADGKAIKIISQLLRHIPPGRAYKVIFMHRDLDEILASQAAMLTSAGKRSADPAVLRGAFAKHLREVRDWLAGQAHIDVLDVDYRTALDNPKAAAERVCAFLGGGLGPDAMVTVVDPLLHRQRIDSS